MSTPRDDERRNCKHCGLRIYLDETTRIPSAAHWWHHGSNLRECYITFAEPGAEQAETPQTREQLEKEWLAQTEWQDFTNWLIHVKLGYIAATQVEDRPAPTPQQHQAGVTEGKEKP